MYMHTIIIDYEVYFKEHKLGALDEKGIRILRSEIQKTVRSAALNAAGANNYFYDDLEDGDAEFYRFKSDSAFEAFVMDLVVQGLGVMFSPLSLSQANILPFAFTHVVSQAEMKRRAERLEAEAGSLPWLDWTDFLDRAEIEILEDFRCVARRNNMREHKVERDWSKLTLGLPVTCSFINETDMVVFRTGI
jgi:hypothetical protein